MTRTNKGKTRDWCIDERRGYELFMKAHGLDDCDLLVELCSVDEYQILLAVMPKLDLPLCKYCNSSNVKRHGYTAQPRRVAHAPIGAIRVQIDLYSPRIRCRNCDKFSCIEPHGIPPRRHQSKDLLDYQLEMYKSRETYAGIAFATSVPQSTTARRIKERIDQ